jgi:hypothetical protein
MDVGFGIAIAYAVPAKCGKHRIPAQARSGDLGLEGYRLEPV